MAQIGLDWEKLSQFVDKTLCPADIALFLVDYYISTWKCSTL